MTLEPGIHHLQAAVDPDRVVGAGRKTQHTTEAHNEPLHELLPFLPVWPQLVCARQVDNLIQSMLQEVSRGAGRGHQLGLHCKRDALLLGILEDGSGVQVVALEQCKVLGHDLIDAQTVVQSSTLGS
jgi:hypothetical protein